MSAHDDGGDYDNDDVWQLWGFLIGLFIVGTLIWNFGWQRVIGSALLIVVVVASVWVYRESELHRYLVARRDIKRIIRQAKRQVKRL